MNTIQANPTQVAGATRSAETQSVTNSSPTNDFGYIDSFESSNLKKFGICITIGLAICGLGLLAGGIKKKYLPKKTTNENEQQLRSKQD